MEEVVCITCSDSWNHPTYNVSEDGNYLICSLASTSVSHASPHTYIRTCSSHLCREKQSV